MRLALYQPDIPQNTGACMRLAACMGVALDLIEPCGFILDDRRMRRSAMDYFDQLDLVRHRSWSAFLDAHQSGPDQSALREINAPAAGPAPDPARPARRLVLLTTRGAVRHVDFAFAPGDTLLLGSESSGVPEEVQAQVDARVRIGLAPGLRSLNMAQAAAIVLAEALRQTGELP